MAASKLNFALCVIGVVLMMAAAADAQLSTTFYSSSCPNLTTRVAQLVGATIRADRSLAPSLMRLHFHDCFVRGCDGSVLLDSNTKGVGSGEKDSLGNVQSLRGFNIIDNIKTQVESMCPGVVSCSDIVALVARDAMATFGGISWTVPLGRRDGVVSSAQEANANLPPPTANFNTLVQLFNNKGFTTREMVVLSGSHTVGVAQCRNFEARLYNFSSTTPTDPTFDQNFANFLKTQCKFGDRVTRIKMDQTKATDTWDPNYYSNLIRRRVLFTSDISLRSNANSFSIARSLNGAGSTFNSEFAAAMVKMGQIGVITGSNGEIRAKCNVIN